MENRQITLTELARRVDLTLANLSILKTNKARAIRFSTLEALCRELKCQPSDLLQFVESTEPGRSIGPDFSEETRHRSDAGLPGDYY